jgi:3D (Asp-Asp-Asp) domain-containing protein
VRPQLGGNIIQNNSLPVLGKEEKFEVRAPNTNFLTEEVGAHLSVYVCVGGDYDFCPDGSKTASGLPVGEGVAACDPSYFKRSFRVQGDPYNVLWTCLDKGGLVVGNVFDLWFYYLSDGQAYKNLFPNPVIAFVD